MTTTTISSTEALLVHTRVILSETAECFEMFANQLKVANNFESAEIFDELVSVQQKRALNVEKMMQGLNCPHIAPWDFTWGEDQSPEIPTADAEVHYLMVPYHALTLAIDTEQWAIDFFSWVAASNAGEDLQLMAIQFSQNAEKFRQKLLTRRESFPPPEPGWDEDPDPPLIQE